MNDSRTAWAFMYTVLPVVLQLIFNKTVNPGERTSKTKKKGQAVCVKERVRLERGV